MPHFAISIALRSNNELISGLIFDPIKDEMFFAEKNGGAFCNNQRIRVSSKNNINDCLFGTGGNIKDNFDFPNRKSGCAALDMAYVACGRYDGYYQNNLNLWDIAAGIVLVKEAGGIVNNIDLDKIQKINLIASSSSISTKFQEKLHNF